MSRVDREKWDRRYLEGAYEERSHPSALLQEWIGKIPSGQALDIACGAGRNALYLAGRGFDVDAVDISGEALRRARDSAQHLNLQVNWQRHDLDDPPALHKLYQLILIIRYVNLPLIEELSANLAPGGFLVCEQHLLTEADVTGPRNPAYRVGPGALALAAKGLLIHCEEEGLFSDPDGRVAALARLVGQRA